MELREAIQAVVNECPDQYAKSYAQAALSLGGSEDAVIVETSGAVALAHKKTGAMMIGEELKVQILYILSNVQIWRGPRAREVKEVLRKAVK